jgi:hypothetical protein
MAMWCERARAKRSSTSCSRTPFPLSPRRGSSQLSFIIFAASNGEEGGKLFSGWRSSSSNLACLSLLLFFLDFFSFFFFDELNHMSEWQKKQTMLLLDSPIAKRGRKGEVEEQKWGVALREWLRDFPRPGSIKAASLLGTLPPS